MTSTILKRAQEPAEVKEPLRYPNGQIVMLGDTYSWVSIAAQWQWEHEQIIALTEDLVATVTVTGPFLGKCELESRKEWIRDNMGGPSTEDIAAFSGPRILISREGER